MSLALLCALGLAGPTLVGVPDPAAPMVTFQAAIRLPELGPRDLTAMRAVTDLLLEGTEEYSAAQLRAYGSQTGAPPHVELMPGFVRIGLSFPKEQFATGASMLESILRRASLTEDMLREYVAKPKIAADDPWGTALWPVKVSVRDLRMQDVPVAYQRYFVPDRVTIALGGAFSESDRAKLAARFEDWTAPRLPRSVLDVNRVTMLLKNDTGTTTVEWRLPEFKSADPAMPTKLLAAYALGIGKESALFRVLREGQRFSYRQEAVLWPTADGFAIRLLAARSRLATPEELSAAREALLKDVEGWTEKDLIRAKAMAASSLAHRIGGTPLYLGLTSPLGASLEDQTFLHAFWTMRTGRLWNPEEVAAQLETVELQPLKDATRSMLEAAMVHQILGMREEPAP